VTATYRSTINGRPSIFVGAYSLYIIDTVGSCQNLGLLGSNQICFDGRLAWAHFYFSGQPKRCLVKNPLYGIVPGLGYENDWGFVEMWQETACTWSKAGMYGEGYVTT
jgi:hypothetical protein